MAGRHRAAHPHPNVARAGVVVAAAGAAVTGPLALSNLAATADASPSVDWDAVAACESSGNWSASDASGQHLGGLQFTQSTWHAYGGSGSPQDASRSEQITVANNVLAGQGIGAWPVCGPKGLGGTTSSSTASTGSSTASTTPIASKHSASSTTAIPSAISDLGVRAASTGYGEYICSPSYAYFAACDPAEYGEPTAFPHYS
jgi:hypothetical protein